MHKLDYFLRAIDKTNEWVGRVISYGIPLLMLVASYEVIARYIFNAPTIWAWDVNKQLFAVIVFLGGGYTLMVKGHISVDVIYAKWSDRKKAIVDIITFPVFLIFTIILLFTLGEFAIVATQEGELMSSAWEPPVYQMKIAVFIGVVLFFLQGIAKFLRDIRVITTGKNQA